MVPGSRDPALKGQPSVSCLAWPRGCIKRPELFHQPAANLKTATCLRSLLNLHPPVLVFPNTKTWSFLSSQLESHAQKQEPSHCSSWASVSGDGSPAAKCAACIPVAPMFASVCLFTFSCRHLKENASCPISLLGFFLPSNPVTSKSIWGLGVCWHSLLIK